MFLNVWHEFGEMTLPIIWKYTIPYSIPTCVELYSTLKHPLQGMSGDFLSPEVVQPDLFQVWCWSVKTFQYKHNGMQYISAFHHMQLTKNMVNGLSACLCVRISSILTLPGFCSYTNGLPSCNINLSACIQRAVKMNTILTMHRNSCRHSVLLFKPFKMVPFVHVWVFS